MINLVLAGKFNSGHFTH